MEDNNVVAGLERTHADMDPCQYVREIYQNSIEAGATDIRFGIDKVAFEIYKVKRGVVIDNGPGIPKDKIKDLINKKNSTSKQTGEADQNFGVGLKVAGLPRNQVGIIVMCRTEQRPKGFMIWLAYGEDVNRNKTAGLNGLISYEQWFDYRSPEIEVHEEPVPLDLIDFQEVKESGYDSFSIWGIDWMAWWDHHTKNKTGTAVILLGNDVNEHTFNHLTTEGRTFLQSRYLSYENNPVFARMKSKTSNAIEHYTLRSPIDTLLANCVDYGTLVYKKNWKCHYFLLNENLLITSEKYQANRTSLVSNGFKEILLYKNELYGDYTNLHALTVASIRNSWGIHYQGVGNRVVIIVEPPVFSKNTKRGVYPNEARSKLSWKESKKSAPLQTIPLEDVRKYFKKNMPESIRELIEEEATKELLEAKESRVAKELSKWLSIPKDNRKTKFGQGLLIHHLNGNQFGDQFTGDLFDIHNQFKPGNPSPNPGPNHKPRKKLSAEELKNREEKRKAREQAEQKRQEPPSVYFHKQSEAQAEEWFMRNGEWQVAYYEKPGVNGQGNKLRINQNHDCFWGYVNCVEDWLKLKGHTMMHKTQIITYIIKPFWEDYGPCAIQHAKTIPSIKRDKEGFASERLTYAFIGNIHFLKEKIHMYHKNFLKANPSQC